MGIFCVKMFRAPVMEHHQQVDWVFSGTSEEEEEEEVWQQFRKKD